MAEPDGIEFVKQISAPVCVHMNTYIYIHEAEINTQPLSGTAQKGRRGRKKKRKRSRSIRMCSAHMPGWHSADANLSIHPLATPLMSAEQTGTELVAFSVRLLLRG